MSEEQIKTGTTPEKNGGGVKAAVLRVLLSSTGGGAGIAIVYFAYELLRANPALFPELLKDWGSSFVLLLGFMWMGNAYLTKQQVFGEKQLDVARESAGANARLATAVESLAARDSEQITRVQLEVGHTMRTVARVEEGQKEILKVLAGMQAR